VVQTASVAGWMWTVDRCTRWNDEDVGHVPEDLADRGVPEQRQSRLDHDREDDDADLARSVQGGLAAREQQQHGDDDEVDALDLEPDLRSPVEQRDEPVPVLPERRAGDHEGGRPGLRPLQAGEAEERVGQVADQDCRDGLRHRQPEGHDKRAVEQELHVEYAAGPEPEEPGRLHLLLGVRDQVNAALLDLERRVVIAGVGDRSYRDVGVLGFRAHRFPPKTARASHHHASCTY
jgi:hypothetical protein